MSSPGKSHNISLRAVLASAALFLGIGTCKDHFLGAVPDKTGMVHFPGFRLDRPWPGNWDSQPVPSWWSLQLNVTRDIKSRSPIYPYGDYDTTAVTAQLVLPPPDTSGNFITRTNHGLSSNETRSWRVSMMAFWPWVEAKVGDPNDTENGTCPTSVVSKDCADLIKLRIRGSIPVIHAEEPDVDLNSTICPTIAGPYDVKKLDLNHDRFNESATVVWQYNQTKLPNAYDDYGSRTFPIVLVWGHTGDAYGGEELDGAALAEDHVQIVCVKADSGSGAIMANLWTTGLAFLVATVWTGLGGL